ncbi:MAG: hypothetical protein IJT88_10835 [Kiritimatiellae bacterium]|nr:hypothetical protein [Kiritimatiellia bacterium]
MKRLLALLFCLAGTVLLLLAPPSASAQSVRCSRCHRAIRNGETYYVSTDHKESYCAECHRYLTPTSCKVCATPMPNGGASFRDEFGYCTNCATLLADALADRCLVCRQPLSQRIAADGVLVCSPACATKYRLDKVGAHAYAALTCASCGRSLAQNDARPIHRYAGQLACSDACAQALFPKCDVCHRRTPSQRRVAGQLVCSDRCARTLMTPCIVCHKPCDAASDAPVCPDCAKTAVQSQAEGEALLATCQGEISWLFDIALGCRPRLVLCDHATLAAASHDIATESGKVVHQGLYTSSGFRNLETGEITLSNCTIYALRDLPREYLRDVLAHEATHHWLAHHAHGRLGDREEGFCEYLATIISLFHKNTAIANAKLDNSLEVYNKQGLMWWIRTVGQPPRAPTRGMAAPWLQVPHPTP